MLLGDDDWHCCNFSPFRHDQSQAICPCGVEEYVFAFQCCTLECPTKKDGYPLQICESHMVQQWYMPNADKKVESHAIFLSVVLLTIILLGWFRAGFGSKMDHVPWKHYGIYFFWLVIIIVINGFLKRSCARPTQSFRDCMHGCLFDILFGILEHSIHFGFQRTISIDSFGVTTIDDHFCHLY